MRWVPDHGEGGAEVVDVVKLAARGRLVLLDHRHVRRGRVRHARPVTHTSHPFVADTY